MTSMKRSVGLLLGALVIATIIHAVDADFSQNESVDRDGIRFSLILNYLAFRDLENPNRKDFERNLDAMLTRDFTPSSGEAFALICGLENYETRARQVLNRIQYEVDIHPLEYGLGYRDDPPPDYQPDTGRDWVSAKIAAMVYERLEEETLVAETNIRLRFFESEARRLKGVELWRLMMQLFGMGLLLSMWLSARQWKRMGERFFRLDPGNLALDGLLRFIALIIVGYVMLGFLAQQMLSALPEWGQDLIIQVLQLAWTVYLIRGHLPLPKGSDLMETLGLNDLKVRFSVLFQVFSGLAILMFMGYLGVILSRLLPMPQPTGDFGAMVSNLSDNPVAGVWFVFISCVITPVFQEVVFRGVLLRGLMAYLRSSRAIILSAALFAVIFPMYAWPQVFMLGIGLGIIYYRNANLLVNIWSNAALSLMTIMFALWGAL